jgi:hypothetical protein
VKLRKTRLFEQYEGASVISIESAVKESLAIGWAVLDGVVHGARQKVLQKAKQPRTAVLCITPQGSNYRRLEMQMLIVLIILILVFGFGGYRMGPGLGYYGGGGLSLILTIVLILLLLKII